MQGISSCDPWDDPGLVEWDTFEVSEGSEESKSDPGVVALSHKNECTLSVFEAVNDDTNGDSMYRTRLQRTK